MQLITNILKKLNYILNKPQKILSVFVLIFTILGSVLECLGVSVIIPVVNIIVNPEAILNNSFVRSNAYLSKLQYQDMVTLIIGGIIGVYLLKNIFFIFISWFRVKFSCKIQREISIKMMESYMNRGYQFFLNSNFGDIRRGITEDTQRLYLAVHAALKLVSEFGTIILICVFMFITDWSLALIVMLMSSVCILLIYFCFRRVMTDSGAVSRRYQAAADQMVLQAFSGIKDVLILRKQNHFIDEYTYNKVRYQQAECKITVGQESPAYIIEGLCISGIMVVVGFKLLMGNTGAEYIAVLAAFAVGAFRILPSLGRISVSLNQMMNSMSAIDGIYKDIKNAEKYSAEHPEMKFSMNREGRLIDNDWKNSATSKKTDKAASVDNEKAEFDSALEIDNITFAYSDELGNVLENVSLKVKKGQSIALIGTSGAGKSTLVDILLGLLVPQAGEIRFDGKKITDNNKEWCEIIGYVPQSVFLSTESLRQNIAFGENKDDIDDSKIWEVLDRVRLGDFVRNLPDGLDTLAGDRGVKLSGGQRQRVAIARALYHDPQILVLDEATSALDNETEAAIMAAVEELQGQVTMIIVAHRLTTIRNCDVIYEVGNKGIKVRNKNDVMADAGIELIE